jgi:hypothetical protein
MDFVDWWKTSSQTAGEEYYKLRFDEAELNDFRCGLLNPSATEKFKRRVKRQNKIVSVLSTGCFALILLVFAPFVCIMVYSFYNQPRSRFVIGLVVGAATIFIIVAVITAAAMLLKYQRNVNADLKGKRVDCEQGRLNIKVETRQRSLATTYSINNVKFTILEDALGAEIHRQFLSPIIIVTDSRETQESYRFYYLPQSKLVLHYEKV